MVVLRKLAARWAGRQELHPCCLEPGPGARPRGMAVSIYVKRDHEHRIQDFKQNTINADNCIGEAIGDLAPYNKGFALAACCWHFKECEVVTAQESKDLFAVCTYVKRDHEHSVQDFKQNTIYADKFCIGRAIGDKAPCNKGFALAHARSDCANTVS